MITRVNTVLAWTDADDNKISARFHNMLMRQDVAFTQQLRRLHTLFALPAPTGRGPYNHHDGMRP